MIPTNLLLTAMSAAWGLPACCPPACMWCMEPWKDLWSSRGVPGGTNPPLLISATDRALMMFISRFANCGILVFRCVNLWVCYLNFAQKSRQEGGNALGGATNSAVLFTHFLTHIPTLLSKCEVGFLIFLKYKQFTRWYNWILHRKLKYFVCRLSLIDILLGESHCTIGQGIQASEVFQNFISGEYDLLNVKLHFENINEFN